jgi:hypothetical protein
VKEKTDTENKMRNKIRIIFDVDDENAITVYLDLLQKAMLIGKSPEEFNRVIFILGLNSILSITKDAWI